MKPYQSIFLTILLCSATYFLLDRRIKVFEQQDHYTFSIETVKMIWTDGRNYGDANYYAPKPTANKIDSLVNARFIPKIKQEKMNTTLIIILGLIGLTLLIVAFIKMNKKCPYCGHRNTTLKRINEHHWDDLYYCNDCKKVFNINSLYYKL
jgi:hypothetical protein